MANTTVDTIKAQAVKPLYAVAGATELAYQYATGYATEAQKSVSKIERDPKALQNQAVGALNARLDELTKDAKKAQSAFEARVSELQKDAQALPGKLQSEIDDAVTEFFATYTELVDRGERIVTLIRKDGVRAVSALRNAPSRSSVVRREKAKAAADNPSNSSRPVKKSATKKPVAKKTPAKTTAKKASATKSAATKTAQNTAKKTASTAQSTAKKAQATATSASA
jgi:hypothetical protein